MGASASPKDAPREGKLPTLRRSGWNSTVPESPCFVHFRDDFFSGDVPGGRARPCARRPAAAPAGPPLACPPEAGCGLRPCWRTSWQIPSVVRVGLSPLSLFPPSAAASRRREATRSTPLPRRQCYDDISIRLRCAIGPSADLTAVIEAGVSSIPHCMSTAFVSPAAVPPPEVHPPASAGAMRMARPAPTAEAFVFALPCLTAAGWAQSGRCHRATVPARFRVFRAASPEASQ